MSFLFNSWSILGTLNSSFVINKCSNSKHSHFTILCIIFAKMIQIKGIFILKILHFSFCTDKLSRHLSNSSISSVSTNSSALPYSTPLSPEAYLASLPSSVPARPEDEMETNSIASINSEMSTNTLRNNNHQQQLIIITIYLQ